MPRRPSPPEALLLRQARTVRQAVAEVRAASVGLRDLAWGAKNYGLMERVLRLDGCLRELEARASRLVASAEDFQCSGAVPEPPAGALVVGADDGDGDGGRAA